MKRSEPVCHCSSVTESEVQDAITTGAGTLGALRKELRVASCCGGCEPRIRQCLANAIEKLPNTGTVPVLGDPYQSDSEVQNF